MTEPGPHEAPTTRRAARAQRERVEDRARGSGLSVADDASDAPATSARHARGSRLARGVIILALATGALLLAGSAAAVTALVTGPQGVTDASADARTAVPLPTVEVLPVPTLQQTPASTAICDVPEVSAAIEVRDDLGAIAAAGGGEAFRAAVAAGAAPCVDLSDPGRVWAVINKTRPYAPLDYRPTGLVMPEGVRSLEGGALRGDAASALTDLVFSARDAGVGEIALESGFRSYEVQQGSYGRQVNARGAEQADLVSARPGYSEHQSGLTGDIVACAGACGSIDDLAGTPQGEWIAAHAWEHGWIVRYEDGRTDVSGYLPEPWHLRYIGADLARAYHDGGWHTLEQFFGLGPAPAYAG